MLDRTGAAGGTTAATELALEDLTELYQQRQRAREALLACSRYSKGERIGRSPRTGAAASITPRRVVLFRRSYVMRERINRRRGEDQP